MGLKLINARVESVTDRPAFRGALERFRCLIPADGFYEWQQLPGQRRKQPFHITRADHELFAFAGLWSVWHRGQADELRSCTILTTAANPLVAQVHDRMPVILRPEQESRWLAPDGSVSTLVEMLSGLGPDEMAMRPVGPAVSDIRNDGPECLLDPPPPAQQSLFAE